MGNGLRWYLQLQEEKKLFFPFIYLFYCILSILLPETASVAQEACWYDTLSKMHEELLNVTVFWLIGLKIRVSE